MQVFTVFFNEGDEYSHCYTAYNYGGTLQGILGKWTVMLYADNGWNFMEERTSGIILLHWQPSASYHIGDFDFTLYMHNPFMAHPKPILQKSSTHYSVSRFVVMTIREVICSVSVLPGISIGERIP